MGRTVTASEANQNFSRLLGEAEAGETITIERRGKPVAQLVPSDAESRARRVEAHNRMIELFDSWPKTEPVPWTRNDLYDDVTAD